MTADSSVPATSVLNGQVVDEQTRQPLPNVTVTAFSSESNLTAQTDRNGQYRISQLLPGNYVLQFKCRGYVPTQKPNVQLKVAETLVVNAALFSENDPGT
jgi:5-hydroxyisourate hydrolase-like protein (transthyretin family)